MTERTRARTWSTVWRGFLRAHRAHLAAVLLVAVVAGGLLSTRMTTPFDETSHFDYVTRVAVDGDVPPLGDRLGQVALADLACFGGPGFAALKCGAPPYDPGAGPWGGVSVATSYAPYFYVVTGLVTKVVHAAGVSTWLVSARIANSVWLLVLVWLLVAIVMRLGGTEPAAFGVGVIAGLMPMVISQSVTVGNDVAGVVGVCFAVWWWLRFRGSGPWLRLGGSLAIAVVAMGIKETATISLFLVLALEFARGVELGPLGNITVRVRSGLVLLASGLLAAFAFAFLKYLFWPSIRGVVPSESGMDALAAQTESRKALFLAYRTANEMFVGPTGPPSSFPLSAIASTIAIVALGSLFFVAFNERSAVIEVRALAMATAAFFLAFPLIIWANLALFGDPFFFQPRYLLPVGIFGLICFASGIRGRVGWVLAGLAALLAALYWLEMWPFVLTGFGTGIPPWP